MRNKQLKLYFSLMILIGFLVWVGVFFRYKADDDNQLKLYFLNVGQGDSEYIKMPDGKDILIDGGPDNSVLAELGKVMDFNDRQIDLVILTHPHADHLSGLIEIEKRYQIGEIWESGVGYQSKEYETWKEMARTKNIKDVDVSKGKTQDFDGVKISILYPLSSLKNQKIDNLNNASIITEIDYNRFSAVFLADAEIEAQSKILDLAKYTQVVKVAHHGSTNGLNQDLFRILRPNLAVIEVGKSNNYGHPAQSTINFLKSLMTQIYRTDQDGTILVESDGISYKARTGI